MQRKKYQGTTEDFEAKLSRVMKRLGVEHYDYNNQTKDSLADRGCPSCGEYISWDALNDPLEYAPPFCKHCGQALDWSKEARP